MIDIKGCPRCHGDLYQEETFGERELVCLQCGHRTYAGRTAAPRPATRATGIAGGSEA